MLVVLCPAPNDDVAVASLDILTELKSLMISRHEMPTSNASSNIRHAHRLEPHLDGIKRVAHQVVVVVTFVERTEFKRDSTSSHARNVKFQNLDTLLLWLSTNYYHFYEVVCSVSNFYCNHLSEIILVLLKAC